MNVKEYFQKDRFAKTVGIELLEASHGKAKARFEIKDKHLNGENITQGGAIFTLADYTLAAAANSYGKTAVTINANISFIKASSKGMLYAEAFEISKKNRIAVYEADIKDSEGEMVAHAQCTFYIKSV